MAVRIPSTSGNDDRTPARKPQRRYSRGQVALMLVGFLLVGAALWHADRLQTIDDPPAVASEPVLSVVIDPGQRLSWARDTEYQVLESFSHCRNPVTVTLDVLVNGAQIAGPITTPSGYVHGELTDPSDGIGSIQLLEDQGQGLPFPHWSVPAGEFVRHYQGGLLFGAPLRTWYPSVVMFGMNAASEARAVLVELRFQANWVLPRSSGTCFVRIPSLQDPFVDPTAAPNTTPWAPAAGPGTRLLGC